MTGLRRVALTAGLAVSHLGSGLVTTLASGADRHLVCYYWWKVAGHGPGARPGLGHGYALASAERTPF